MAAATARSVTSRPAHMAATARSAIAPKSGVAASAARPVESGSAAAAAISLRSVSSELATTAAHRRAARADVPATAAHGAVALPAGICEPFAPGSISSAEFAPLLLLRRAELSLLSRRQLLRDESVRREHAAASH